MELWATYTFEINGKEISVVAKDYDTARKKADEKYSQLYK